jgi:hypothetical protein
MEILILVLTYLFQILIGLILAVIGVALLIVAIPIALVGGIIVGPFFLLGFL